jgi:hypothetical protein
LYFYDVNQGTSLSHTNSSKMTNTTPWQVMRNANNPTTAVLTDSQLTTKKQASVTSAKKKAGTVIKMMTMPRRYSFDDNGGGYRGL